MKHTRNDTTSTEPKSRIDDETVAIPAYRAEEIALNVPAARRDLDRMLSDFLIAVPADEVERRDRFCRAAAHVAMMLECGAETVEAAAE